MCRTGFSSIWPNVIEGLVATIAGQTRVLLADIQPDQTARLEAVIEKSVNSAFIGTDLEDFKAGGIDTVVISGLTTDHCCSTTARMDANLSLKVWFVADATATFDRTGAGRQC